MKLALSFTSGLLSLIHHNVKIKALCEAQAGYQLPTAVRQFPETALDTTVSSSTSSLNYLLLSVIQPRPQTKRNTGTPCQT